MQFMHSIGYAFSLAGRRPRFRAGALTIAMAVTLGSIGPAAAQSRDWLSGQGSPVHDSDRMTPLSGKTVVLEDGDSQVVGKRLTYAQLTGKDADALHHPEAGTGQEEPF